MTRYDPLTGPSLDYWRSLSEDEQIEQVLEYHRAARANVPNERIHASLHVVVENQIALGDETPVADTLERLMAEDLDRHEALHAIASVLARHITQLLQQSDVPDGDPNTPYYEGLRTLTAETWRAQAD